MNYENRLEKREQEEAEREAQRLARPLVERLRDSGTFRASDGLMSIKTGDYRDAHEAADILEVQQNHIYNQRVQIENLEEVITRLIMGAGKMVDAYPDAVDDGSVESLTKAAIAYEQLRGVLADIEKRA